MTGFTFKDQISESSATLFVAIALCAFAWSLTGTTDLLNWGGFAVTLVVAGSLRHMSNGNALMRTRTWMVPSTFLILCGAIFSLHPLNAIQIGVVSYAVSQYYLLQSYQEYHAERLIVVAFLFLGIASFFFPPLLYLAILYYVSMLVQLRAFTFRTLLAGFFGLLVVMEIYAGGVFLFGNVNVLYSYIFDLTDIRSFKIPQWTILQIANLGVVGLLLIIGCFHYARTNFNDKIRTRMCFYIVMLQVLGLLALLCLQPQNYKLLLPFLVFECSPIVGHYIVYSRGRFAGIMFIFILLLCMALTTFNYLWTQSLISF